jgi:hypothetical protein
MQQGIGLTVPLTLKAIKYDPTIMDMTASTKNDTTNRVKVTNEFYRLSIEKFPKVCWLIDLNSTKQMILFTCNRMR